VTTVAGHTWVDTSAGLACATRYWEAQRCQRPSSGAVRGGKGVVVLQ